MASQDPPSEAAPWHAAFPSPRKTCTEVTADELMNLFDDMDLTTEPKKFLLVDVRRTDWEGGTIKTSINLPAQSFYQTRKALFDLCDRAGIKEAIFYCGSSTGRGPRCAGWFQDYIDDIAKFGRKSSVSAKVLKGGIKGWVKEFEGSLVDCFEEGYWKQFQ